MRAVYLFPAPAVAPEEAQDIQLPVLLRFT